MTEQTKRKLRKSWITFTDDSYKVILSIQNDDGFTVYAEQLK